MMNIRPKKSLGQHFLKDREIARRIAETLSACRGLPVLEVGAGTGVLTRFLLDLGHDLSVVEIDALSVRYLEQHFPALSGGRIHAEDFLGMQLNRLYGDAKFCITGNYPYYISSQIFFKVLEWREQVVCCSGMIQKEVAERLSAAPGSRRSGILSALIQPWYDVEYLFTVDEGAFDPPPKVKSAVVRLTRNGRTGLGCDEALYRTVVKTSFNQRRKMLRNSMKPLLGKDCPCFALPVFDRRPEQLSIEGFIELTLIAGRYLEEAAAADGQTIHPSRHTLR
ncbi:MAG: 16S rRNA (adenine(1518)-N(6)/adenine(1519)-N(6))-dimethyltransferase RsmA [Tannerella sp.]|jgi:16S rRNA (adenine1518-N6/adenine1519-N6)-dimethyltransferase|nr:16S rRNA (adenine(1518)-N(6)/adenine(1519)-N(6))-dimethyltransferase RsmA [Tannerella sp.]